MTDVHYEHVQGLIKRELGGRLESSGWFAGALASLGMAATIGVTVFATNIPNAAHRGKLETAGWFLLVFGIFCLLVHFFGRRRTGEQRAQDIIDMMDRYNMQVEAQSASVAPMSGTPATGQPAWPATATPFGEKGRQGTASH